MKPEIPLNPEAVCLITKRDCQGSHPHFRTIPDYASFSWTLFVAGVEDMRQCRQEWEGRYSDLDRRKKAHEVHYSTEVVSLTAIMPRLTVGGIPLPWYLLRKRNIRYNGAGGDGYCQFSFHGQFLTGAYLAWNYFCQVFPDLKGSELDSLKELTHD